MPDYTQDANCVGAWLFTEGSGTTVADATGNEHTANFSSNGHPAWITTVPDAYVDYSVDFNATTPDYIDVDGEGSFEGLSNLGACFWIFVVNYGTTQRILHKNGAWNISLDYSNPYYRFSFGTYIGTFSSIATNYEFNAGWNFVAGSWKGDGSIWEIYVGGIEKATSSRSGTLGTSANPMRFGLDEDGTSFPQAGYLCEIGIFNRSISSTEINDIMDNGLVGGGVAATGYMTANSKFWG